MNARMLRRPAPSLVLPVAFLALAACGRREETPAPAKAAPLRVTLIETGKAVDADGRVSAPAVVFAPRDTMYVSVVTEGRAPSAVVAARWTFEGGYVLREDRKTIVPSGRVTTDFRLFTPGERQVGKYQVEVSLDDTLVDTRTLEVRP